jgi:hypothetical protein
MLVSVRCVLSASEGVELTKLVGIADGSLITAQSQVMATNNPHSESPTSFQQPTVDCSSDERLANVEKQLSELATAVKSIQTSLETLANTNERSRDLEHCYTARGEHLSFSTQIRGNAQPCLLPWNYKSSKPSEKLKQLTSSEAAGDSPTDSNTQEYRLHVLDKRSRRYFLMDCGSSISVIPTSFVNHHVKSGLLKLCAANTTEIDTYGEKNLKLHLNLRTSFKWNFVIANLRSPIIGADFLSRYGLLIDLKNHRLIDTDISVKTDTKFYHASEFGISTVNKTLQYSDLSQFMDVTTTSSSKGKSGKSVLHHIVITGPPVAERPRRLTREKLTSAKA